VRRVARRTGRRRGREPGEGARTGAAEYIAGVNTYTTGGIYYAGNAFTPGTPTPRHRQAGHDYTVAPP
jgi:hypothetical protein